MTTGAQRRRPALAALMVGVALGAAGCSLVPVEENTFEESPLPATTDANAERVLATVDGEWSAADAARDPALLAEVVAEPLLSIDSAAYALDTMTDPDDADPAQPVRHLDPTVFIPRFAGYPQWFVVAAPERAGASPQLVVLTRTDAAADWSVPIAPELLPDVEFPVLALDELGYVVPLSSSTPGDLPIGLEQLAQLHATALGAAPAAGAPTATPTAAATTAPVATPAAATSRALNGTPAEATTSTPPSAATTSTVAPSATTSTAATPSTPATAAAPAVAAAVSAALGADPWTIARREADAAAAEAVGAAATVVSTYAMGSVVEQALRTEDGGALVFYTVTGQRAYTVTPTYYLQLDETTAAIVGSAEVSAELTEEWAAQLAVYLPPDPEGVPRVVAARWDRTGLSGS